MSIELQSSCQHKNLFMLETTGDLLFMLSPIALEYFSKQYKKGFSFDCNLVLCLALFYYFPALLVEIDCSLIGNSQVDVHEGKFTLSVGWCWSCWKNAFCPSRKEV